MTKTKYEIVLTHDRNGKILYYGIYDTKQDKYLNISLSKEYLESVINELQFKEKFLEYIK